MKKKIIAGIIMLTITGGLVGCSSSSNMEVEINTNANASFDEEVAQQTALTRAEIESEALRLKPEEFRKSSFGEAMTLINTEYIENMPLEEAGQRLMEAADQLTYLPTKVYNLLKEKGLVIYIGEDLGKCYHEVMEIEGEANEEELYGGMYTADSNGKPLIFMSADDVGSSLYHEIGHAVDYLSNQDENLISYSYSKEFDKIYEKEKAGSRWKDMDNFNYYTQDNMEYFAESFQNYCDSIYFDGALDELYNSIPLTMKFIDSMVK